MFSTHKRGVIASLEVNPKKFGKRTKSSQITPNDIGDISERNNHQQKVVDDAIKKLKASHNPEVKKFVSLFEQLKQEALELQDDLDCLADFFLKYKISHGAYALNSARSDPEYGSQDPTKLSLLGASRV